MVHVAIADDTHEESATASTKDLITVAQDNFTNETAGVLVEYQLQPPQDWVTVSQEQELSTNQTAELSMGDLF